jgi:hypothetical protein
MLQVREKERMEGGCRMNRTRTHTHERDAHGRERERERESFIRNYGP